MRTTSPGRASRAAPSRRSQRDISSVRPRMIQYHDMGSTNDARSSARSSWRMTPTMLSCSVSSQVSDSA